MGSKILLVGDILIDEWIICNTSGLSPEAPIPIWKVKKKIRTLGGAGNVLKNLVEILKYTDPSTDIRFLGPICSDIESMLTAEALGFNSTNIHPNVWSKSTSVKRRIIQEEPHIQIARFDEDDKSFISAAETKNIIDSMKRIVDSKGMFDVAIISDYLHNSLNKEIIEAVCDLSREVIADPKGEDIERYRGVSIITPNLKELSLLVKGDTSPEEKARTLALNLNCEVVLKKSGEGLSLHNKHRNAYLGAYRNGLPVVDPTGAGDTLIATLGAARALGFDLISSLEKAVKLAGISVCFPGCWTPKKRYIEEILDV